MIDTIIFDGEGVVIDTEGIWDRGQAEFLERRGFAYDRERTKPLLTGRTLLEGTRTLMEEHGFGGDPDALARERLEIVKDLFATEVDFVDGFPEFFRSVRHTHKTGVATSLADELLDVANRRLELSKLFGGRVYSVESVGCRSKPYPDLLLHVAGELGSDPESCLVLEDSPHGIEAARRAGMLSVGITTTYDADLLRHADLVVGSFAELARWMRNESLAEARTRVTR